MFETSASSNFKSNNGCYALDKESLLWMRKSCGMKKNFLCSRVEAYTDVYTFNDTQQLDIETAGNTNVTLCTSNNASSSTLTDSAVSLNDLDLLVSNDVCSYNETTSPSQSTSTLTAEYFISDSSSDTTTSSDQSSDAEQSTQMLMTSTVHVQNVNFTLEEREALINAIVSKLIIDVKSTLKSQSLLYSAEDRRPSAQALGYVAIGIIVFVLCVIVAIDAPNVYYLLRTQQKKLFNR
uniref:C-type lectin domain-containing protein n=1 Tax=Biomphalaria glabrata TaxID=6526 RepID=A0A2C9LGI2_BIOGL